MPKTFDDLTRTEAEAHCDAFAASLGPRLEWFVAHVAAPGGPSPDELDGSLESLDKVAAWLAGQPADAGASRDGVELPLWVPLEPGFTASWGPRMLLVADGLAAYFAKCFRVHWPMTEWRVHDGKKIDVNYRQPMLFVDGGRWRVNAVTIGINLVDRFLLDRTDNLAQVRGTLERYTSQT